MRPRHRYSISIAALLVLAVLEVRSFPLRDLAARLRTARQRGEIARFAVPTFWFDRDYSSFVEAVRSATPESATVALVAPRTTDLYVYRAVYGLVPRRVVGAEEWDRADYVAVYGRAAPPLPAGRAIPGGALLRR